MTPAEVLPGVAAFLHDVRSRGVRTVLGSASKNAGTILDRCGLRPLFDAVVESRRNRRDGWYLQPAGHIDLCNISVPVRIAD